MSELTNSERIQLQIGEKIFTTTKATVAPSNLLATLVNLPPPHGAPYFIDADPALFEYILRYLRTGMFPLFYDSDNGHDHCLYFTILTQARFYQIEKLEAWIGNKLYLEAVTSRTSAGSITLCGEDQIQHLDDLTHLKHETLKIVNVKQSNAKCFRCPTRNWKHDGHRQNCVRDGCLSRYASSTAEVEMRVLHIDYVVTAVHLHDDRVLPVVDESTLPPPYHDS